MLGLPPARGFQLARLTGLHRLAFLYDNGRARHLLAEEAVRACSQLCALHLDGAPTRPGVSRETPVSVAPGVVSACVDAWQRCGSCRGSARDHRIVLIACLAPTPRSAVPLLALVLRRLQLGAPRLRQLSTSCPGVEAGLRRILELEASGGAGYDPNEVEPAGPWMCQLLQQAGGAAGVRAAEATWLRGVWSLGMGVPPWLDPWQLPAWDAE